MPTKHYLCEKKTTTARTGYVVPEFVEFFFVEV
jgi:hypothetical protein